MLNQLFDQVYIINLIDRADRRAEMNQQLGLLGLSLASDRVRLFAAVKPESPAGFPNIGTRGCFMSHLSVLEDAVHHQYRSILIIEDDCNFSPALVDSISEVKSLIQQTSWSMLYGGQIKRDKPASRSQAIQLSLIPPAEGIMGAHFVALRHDAIMPLAGYLQAMLKRPAGDPAGGPMHVDGAYSWFRAANPHLQTVMCTPQIAYQRSSRTDIHEHAWYDNSPLTKGLAESIRRIKNKLQTAR
jgi:GR25 family glycosyltransferase involved in LPS biosynthesis